MWLRRRRWRLSAAAPTVVTTNFVPRSPAVSEESVPNGLEGARCTSTSAQYACVRSVLVDGW